MIDPGFGADELEQAYAFKVGDRALASKHSLHGNCIDDPVRRQPSAKQPLPDGITKMVEKLRREVAWRSLDPPIENDRREIAGKGAPGQ